MKSAEYARAFPPAFVTVLLVERGEEPLLPQTLAEIFSQRSGTGPVFLFTREEASHAELQQHSDLQHIQLKENVSIGRALAALPKKFSSHDILLVRPGFKLPPCWDGRLQWAALADNAVGTVSPLCDNSPVFALFESEKQKAGASVELVNRAAYWCGRKKNYEVPFFFERCCYFRRAALDRLKIESLAVEKDFVWQASHRLRNHGFLNVVCDHVYIQRHEKLVAPEKPPFADEVEVARILRFHPLWHTRTAVAKAVHRKKTIDPIPGLKEPTVQLHVMHGWGGGLEHWVRSYCRADQARTNLILKPLGDYGAFGQTLALYDHVEAEKPAVLFDLTRPIRATAISHLEYQYILDKIIEKFGVDHILVSSLIGHSLDLLTRDLPTAFICHDYYPFCPAINIHFNGVCADCGEKRLTDCFKENEFNRFFRNVSTEDWLPLRQRFREIVLDRQVPLFVPSDSVREHWTELDPAMRQAKFITIPHGMNSRKPLSTHQPREAGSKLRIVVLGSLALQKGHNLFKTTHRELSGVAEFYLVGCGPEGEEFKGPGVEVISRYEHGQLPEILDKIAPDCGLLLSVWPETFSYTLAELSQFGIPPVATNLGAFRNKIQHGVNGLLFEPSPQCFLQTVRNLHADRAVLVSIRDRLRQTQLRTLDEMVSDYHRLLPERKFSPQRYAEKPNPEKLKSVKAPPPKLTLKEYMRQQVKTPTLRAWKKSIAAKLRK